MDAIPTGTTSSIPTGTASPIPTDTTSSIPTDTANPTPADRTSSVPTDRAGPIPTGRTSSTSVGSADSSPTSATSEPPAGCADSSGGTNTTSGGPKTHDQVRSIPGCTFEFHGQLTTILPQQPTSCSIHLHTPTHEGTQSTGGDDHVLPGPRLQELDSRQGEETQSSQGESLPGAGWGCLLPLS